MIRQQKRKTNKHERVKWNQSLAAGILHICKWNKKHKKQEYSLKIDAMGYTVQWTCKETLCQKKTWWLVFLFMGTYSTWDFLLFVDIHGNLPNKTPLPTKEKLGPQRNFFTIHQKRPEAMIFRKIPLEIGKMYTYVQTHKKISAVHVYI